MLETLNGFAEKYGLFVIGGAIGAVIHRLRNKMSIRRFFASIGISMFVSLSVGVIAKDYFELKQSIIYVLCGISGVFSNTILDELEEIIKNLSVFINNKLGISEVKIEPNPNNPSINPSEPTLDNNQNPPFIKP